MGYNDKYYIRHACEYKGWEIQVGRLITNFMHPTSVLDLGCGVGSYLEGMYLSGMRGLKGIEYNYDIAEKYIPSYMKPFIEKGDITKPLNINVKDYDIVMSVEAAEHIQPEGTEQFIANLAMARSCIVLTAAPPGQGGTGHINLRSKEFWIEAIESRGFTHYMFGVRDMLAKIDSLPCPKYIKRNLMIFYRGT